MSNTTQYQPSAWFDIPSPAFNQSFQVWPWLNMNVEQWTALRDFIAYSQVMVTFPYAYIHFPIACVSSLAIVFTLLMKTDSKTMFRRIMISVALLDLAFAVLKFSRYYINYHVSDGMVLYIARVGATGVASACSLTSDMLTLCLTMDKYIALAKPMFYMKCQRRGIVGSVWLVGALLSSLVGATRLHSAVDNAFLTLPVAKEPWFMALSFFSDSLIPFILTSLMVMFVLGLLVAVYTRRNAVQKVGVFSKNDEERADDVAIKMMPMLVVLMLMFSLNQFGYMVYSIASLVYRSHSINYDSTYSEIYTFAVSKANVNLSSHATNFFECFTRAVPFFVYLICSKYFRRDFIAAVKGLFRAK